MTTQLSPTDSPNDALQQVNQALAETYDKHLYESNAFFYSSPVHLRAAARLYGLDSVPLKNARVLELGCAGGGNLLPFALTYPDAHLVGVDLSPVQVQQGRELVGELGIKNMHLHAMSLTDITPEFGQFDYIIAHGVFSWVPPEVRAAIFRVVRENLSPQGLAYISYNTYPGWKAGDIVRDAMLLHSHAAQTDGEKLASAKAVLNLLSDGVASSNPLAPSLKNAVDQFRRYSDYYIAHEYLESFNSPCYLLEFVEMAQQQGVAHVGDADPFLEMPAAYGQNVHLNHSLIAFGQPRELRQQYLDFAVGRNFRKSIVVHAERLAEVGAGPDMERLGDLRWAGYFGPAASTEPGITAFTSRNGTPLGSREPGVIAVAKTLGAAWPKAVDSATLVQQGRKHLSELDSEAGKQAILDGLQTLFKMNALFYSLDDACPYDGYDVQLSMSRPCLIPGIAQLLEKRKNPAFGIGLFNLWHEFLGLKLKEAEAFLMPLLDGSNTTTQLRTRLRDALSQGVVSDMDGKSLKGQRNLDQTAGKILKNLLDLLHRSALLKVV